MRGNIRRRRVWLGLALAGAAISPGACASDARQPACDPERGACGAAADDGALDAPPAGPGASGTLAGQILQ